MSQTVEWQALEHPDPSVRLRAALAVGTAGADLDAEEVTDRLIERCAIEPDFFVRDMLTWALCRQPADVTVPQLLKELDSDVVQARSQALHTLSKIGDGRAWPFVSTMLHEDHDEVARTAWRAAVALVPADAVDILAADLATEFGRRTDEVRRSLSRALIGLGQPGRDVAQARLTHPVAAVADHAAVTIRLFDDPDSGFADAHR